MIKAVAVAAWLLLAQAPEPPAIKCIPVPVLIQKITTLPGFSNLRRVDDAHTGEALALFAMNARGQMVGDWTFAMLLDGPKGEGLLLVGKDEMICQYGVLSAADYTRLVRQLEGERI